MFGDMGSKLVEFLNREMRELCLEGFSCVYVSCLLTMIRDILLEKWSMEMCLWAAK